MLKNNYLSIYAKSFNWAAFFLPKNTYKDCSSLYDFCRTVDNIADDKNDLNIKIKKLSEFKSQFLNKNFDSLVIRNMWSLIENYKISIKVIDDLFDGIESDLSEIVKLNTKKELLIYSYRVAGTVGLMMAKILNVEDKKSMKAAIDLGIAMQLTNVSRDVVEDANNNRFYIEYDFENIKKTLRIADLFYESSFNSIKKIPFTFRFAILVARRIYKKIGDNILQKRNIDNYNKSGKIYVSNFSKLFETFLSIYDLILLSFTNEKSHLREEEHLLIKEEINLDERI